MRGCPDKTFDFAIARNINLGGNRQLQLRAELYNAFNAVIITGRNTTMNIASLETASTATNLPYDAAGNLIPARAIPSTAGFGVATDCGGSSAGCRCRFGFSSRHPVVRGPRSAVRRERRGNGVEVAATGWSGAFSPGCFGGSTRTADSRTGGPAMGSLGGLHVDRRHD